MDRIAHRSSWIVGIVFLLLSVTVTVGSEPSVRSTLGIEPSAALPDPLPVESISDSLAQPTQPSRALSFEERVEWQRRIEEVRWRYTIWPEENPTPKPALSEVLSDDAIRSKVEDALRKSSALEAYWQRPITAAQLQAEMERMARGTRHAELLLDLFAALDNDPFLIAECLARPVLSDRLLRNWYAYDSRFHGDVGAAAESATAGGVTASELPVVAEKYEEVTFEKAGVEDEGRSPGERGALRLDAEEWSEELRRLAGRFGVGRTAEPQGREFGAAVTDVSVDAADEIEALFAEIPLGEVSALEETVDGWGAVTVLSKSEGSIRLGIAQWPKLAFTTWWAAARGDVALVAEPLAGAYTLATVTGDGGCTPDTWRVSVHDDGTPWAREGHTAVWTGARMIVWGGRVLPDFPFNTGGVYDPGTDSWTPTSLEGAPSARTDHTAVWTGDRMIVWGGIREFPDFQFSTGGLYDPVTDSWTPTSVEGAPEARFRHTAVWTGSRMIVWGGRDDDRDLTNTGGLYDPGTDSWTRISVAGAPLGRVFHTAVWTGARMIVWGGDLGAPHPACNFTNTGGVYDPGTDSWTPTSVEGAPSERDEHTAVWTGDRMIVWGGDLGYPYPACNFTNTGGNYDPVTDSWTPTSVEGAPSERDSHTAVWTGDRMIVWGGAGLPDTGGVYVPGTDSWAPTSVEGAPSARFDHTAIYTGSEMIIWGGSPFSNQLGSYCPWLPPPIFTSPECGSTIHVEPGETVEFTVTAEDSPVRTVTLDASEVPPDATMDPALPTTGNPVSSQFSWTTDVSHVNTIHVVEFTATNDELSYARCEVTIDLTVPPPIFTSPECGSTIHVEPGETVEFAVIGEDSLERTVTLDSSGLSPNATMDPTLPITGNPVSSMLTWTTDLSHSNTIHVVEFTATNDLLSYSNCEVTIDLTVPPPSFTNLECGSTIRVEPGQTVGFTVTAEDSPVRTVTLDASGLPPDATMDPALPTTGNPVSSNFSWTTDASHVDTIHLVEFTATSDAGSYARCEVTIEIPPPPPPIFTSPECSSTIHVEPGEAVEFTVTAEDSPLRTVTLDESGLPPNAIMDPTLPITGNPVSSHFNWATDLSDSNAIHVLEFTATSDVGSYDRCEVTVDLTVPPPSFTNLECGTTIRVEPGETVEFTVTAEDSPARTVTLDASGLPPDATMNPALPTTGNPVSSNFSWTTNLSHSNTIHLMEFTATSDAGSHARCEVTVDLTVPPPSFIDLECGSTIRVEPGQTVEFTVTAEDSPVRTVTLDASGLPPDATMDPVLPITGNPVSSQFSWTTDVSHVNTIHLVEFTATSDAGSYARCAVTIEIPPPPPPIFTSPECSSTIHVEPGETVEFTVTAEDSPLRTVTLDASGLPPDATMNPALPTTGNPVSSQFNWATDVSHVNTIHVVEFTATSDAGSYASCGVAIEIPPPPPPIFTSPECSSTIHVEPGETVEFTVTAEDSPLRTVTLDGSGLPPGAILDPTLPTTGNPVSSQFSWTTDVSHVSTIHVVEFTATSDLLAYARCEVTIEFPPPIFINYGCGTTARVEPGETIAFTLIAEDAPERSVTLDASGLPPGAIMDPALPITGNPVSSMFTWTTDVSHSNTIHEVLFTATNEFGSYGRCWVGIEVAEPTLVTLVSFTAIPGDGQVTLHWTTASEIDNAGFYLLRSTVATRGTARLHKGLIPARGDVFTGADYTFVDETVTNGVEYEYTLVDVDLYGTETIHPPVRAIPNPPSPPVKLLSPARREASYPTTPTHPGYAERLVRSIKDE